MSATSRTPGPPDRAHATAWPRTGLSRRDREVQLQRHGPEEHPQHTSIPQSPSRRQRRKQHTGNARNHVTGRAVDLPHGTRTRTQLREHQRITHQPPEAQWDQAQARRRRNPTPRRAHHPPRRPHRRPEHRGSPPGRAASREDSRCQPPAGAAARNERTPPALQQEKQPPAPSRQAPQPTRGDDRHAVNEATDDRSPDPRDPAYAVSADAQEPA